jgi:hypothetical protein
MVEQPEAQNDIEAAEIIRIEPFKINAAHLSRRISLAKCCTMLVDRIDAQNICAKAHEFLAKITCAASQLQHAPALELARIDVLQEVGDAVVPRLDVVRFFKDG